jgi:heme-degrading monooxygenase HmoA
MSVHATNTFRTNPGQAGELVETLRRVLPDTLTHGGCEEIRIWCDQDDPDSVVSLTRWATRADYEAYLAWREQTGDTAMFRGMLVRPMEVHYYDEVFVTVAQPAAG